MSRREWHADALRSYATGIGLRGMEPASAEQHPVARISRAQAIWVELVFVAICHQTNWDLLHDHMLRLALDDPGLIAPDRLADVGVDEGWLIFGAGLERGNADFADRCRLLRSLGQSATKWPTFSDLATLSEREVSLGGDRGFYSQLDSIPVYAVDPLRKKARVLVHQLVRFGLIRVSDESSIAPAIDYHLIRLYIRTARVVPAMPDMYASLIEGKTLRIGVVTRLREAVEEAMWHTAEGAGMRMDQLNHVEWQIARSFCVRVAPRCFDTPIEEKPVDQPLHEMAAAVGGCPLSENCAASSDPGRRMLKDPRLARSFY